MEQLPEVNREKVLTMALVHDWAEAEIDDIAHNIKRDYPKVREALKEAEVGAMRIYPEPIFNAFINYEEGTSTEAMIVKLADSIQCVQYLEHEIALGNKFMEPLLIESNNYVSILSNKLGISPR
jgi:5'-deoxynucleotidase YfbR-like HD superfamily hydrolase